MALAKWVQLFRLVVKDWAAVDTETSSENDPLRPSYLAKIPRRVLK